MRPWLRVFTGALVVGLLAGLAGGASAQYYDAARRVLEFAPDPLARSARLVGMGRLTLVGDDPHNQISMWDFASNPTGVAEDDSASTFEIRPGSASHSAVRDEEPGSSVERQTLAGREVHLGYEGWRRTREGTAYGAIGDLGMLRLDQPYSPLSERRQSVSDPSLQAVITGRVPWLIKSPRFHYALRATASKEASLAEYRAMIATPAGVYLDQNGATLEPPIFLVPNLYDVLTLGGGLALSYRAGSWLTAALGGDYLSLDVQGRNDGKRYNASTQERRAVGQGQATLIGRIGPHLEWGADGRLWTSGSEPRWDFTISAGIGSEPLAGRGKLLTRDEFGTALRSRARWVQGPFEIAAGLTTGYQDLEITPPKLTDATSLNRFLNTASLRSGADSLALPDSVVYNRSQSRTREAVLGAAWKLPGRRGTVGIEYHIGREDLVQTISLGGPRRRVREFRSGLEYRIGGAILGRTGYFYRSDDRDEFTYGNRYSGNGATLGFGLHPQRALWSFEAGYALYWYRIQDGDPTQPRGTRQQLQAQLRWAL